MNWSGPAKLNLWLRIYERDDGGMHPLESLVALVAWGDTLAVEASEDDAFDVTGPMAQGVPDDDTNLVWKAVESARADTGYLERLSVELVKQVPAGAGLGGGSSDAAAMLAAFDQMAGSGVAERLAPDLGADVPLFLGATTQHMSGYGERLEEVGMDTDFAVSIVVPPFALSTPEVYSAWDELGGPVDAPNQTRGLPPSLRGLDLFNDLYPAALHVCPELGDVRADLVRRWGRPVFMSGSGSALFAYFADVEEAQAAALTADSGSRVRVGTGLSADGVYAARD